MRFSPSGFASPGWVDDVRGVAGFILPGDFVDVVLISEDPAFQREGYSDILLHHVKVLAIDQLVAERPEQPTIPMPQNQGQLADVASQ
jgi:Flp pilus assembly protein CpaB